MNNQPSPNNYETPSTVGNIVRNMGKILLTLSTAILKNPNKVPALDSHKKGGNVHFLCYLQPRDSTSTSIQD